MNKNIFIVRSPLQIINAIEAKEHFNLQNTLLVLMFNRSTVNTEQMKKTASILHWDEIIEYEKSSKKSSLLNQVKFINKLQKYSYDYLFSGDFGTINQVLIANLNCKQIYLIDDGTTTIFVHEKLAGKQKVPFSKKVKLLRYRLFGLKNRIDQTINFFTCYNIHPIHNELIVQNTYSYMQDTYLSETIIDSKTYVLGQNFTEAGYMEDDAYISYIKMIINHYDTEIVYIPHRSEIISDKLEALFNEKFKLQKNVGPIELTFLMQKIYPAHIISFISAALFTLNKIFPNAKIDAVRIDSSDLIARQHVIKSCYEFFDGTGVNVVDIKPEAL